MSSLKRWVCLGALYVCACGGGAGESQRGEGSDPHANDPAWSSAPGKTECAYYHDAYAQFKEARKHEDLDGMERAMCKLIPMRGPDPYKCQGELQASYLLKAPGCITAPDVRKRQDELFGSFIHTDGCAAVLDAVRQERDTAKTVLLYTMQNYVTKAQTAQYEACEARVKAALEDRKKAGIEVMRQRFDAAKSPAIAVTVLAPLCLSEAEEDDARCERGIEQITALREANRFTVHVKGGEQITALLSTQLAWPLPITLTSAPVQGGYSLQAQLFVTDERISLKGREQASRPVGTDDEPVMQVGERTYVNVGIEFKLTLLDAKGATVAVYSDTSKHRFDMPVTDWKLAYNVRGDVVGREGVERGDSDEALMAMYFSHGTFEGHKMSTAFGYQMLTPMLRSKLAGPLKASGAARVDALATLLALGANLSGAERQEIEAAGGALAAYPPFLSAWWVVTHPTSAD